MTSSHRRCDLKWWVRFMLVMTCACYGNVVSPGEKGPPGTSPELENIDDSTSDPGRVTLHRLNRVEYNNTVRDLLGTSMSPGDAFPSDGAGEGFDTIADVLNVSPIQAELYQRAAVALADEALAIPWGTTRVGEAESSAVTHPNGGRLEGTTAWALLTTGQVIFPVNLTAAGTYRVAVRAFARQGGPDVARMEVRLDGKAVRTFEVGAVASAPEVYELTLDIPAGSHQIAAAFTNDFANTTTREDRNLYVDWFRVTGPKGQGDNPIRTRLMVCTPDPANPVPCMSQIVRTFARRAWRRPVTDEEVAALVALRDVAQKQGEGVDRALALAVEAILSSPYFLYRFEKDPDPNSLEPRMLNAHELASRLSYFLWSTMPDDELLDLADSGRLSEPAELQAQITRMLADPKAMALVDNFASQWINWRGLEEHQIDADVYPNFDDTLRADMMEETKLLLREFLVRKLPLSELLTANYTFVSPRLAGHYGMQHPGGEGFQRVDLTGGRRGLLGQGSVLTVTSYPTRTSPVFRGKWVLQQLLCFEPAPPPPGVEGLEGKVDPTLPLRDQMAQHRTNPACYGCHAAMDPLGFAMENFDGIGTWRDKVGEHAIDASGELPDGRKFNGVGELADTLSRDPHFYRCAIEKMMTYALGRGLHNSDDKTLRRLEADFTRRGHRLTDLVPLIATSRPFLYRRGEPVGGEPVEGEQ
jgi:hypothetical protein